MKEFQVHEFDKKVWGKLYRLIWKVVEEESQNNFWPRPDAKVTLSAADLLYVWMTAAYHAEYEGPDDDDLMSLARAAYRMAVRTFRDMHPEGMAVQPNQSS